MHVILFMQRGGRAWSLNLGQPAVKAAVAVAALTVLGSAFGIGIALGERSGLTLDDDTPAEWARAFARQQEEIEQLR
ncbi:MAG: hypothetical protein NZM12_14090, partial [Steroidobacteraceae bacterium]|nr:hypothetical protein [Steroidobacteraceae bacterium]